MLPHTKRPPLEGYADIVLFTGRYDLKRRRARLLPKLCFRWEELAEDIWLGPLDDLADHVVDACEPRGFDTLRVSYGGPTLYALVRTNSPFASRLKWDSDGRLSQAIQLARLIRPTTLGYHFAARLLPQAGKSSKILPTHHKGPGAIACIASQSFDGFVDADVPRIRALLRAFAPHGLPQRVKRALWLCENIFWQRTIDLRWALVVTALEALVHIDERSGTRRASWGSTQQFVNRLWKLAEYVPGLRWTKFQLSEAYELRSSFVHGIGIGMDALQSRQLKSYLRLENGLRRILVRCIHKPTVAAMFADDASVRLHLGAAHKAPSTA